MWFVVHRSSLIVVSLGFAGCGPRVDPCDTWDTCAAAHCCPQPTRAERAEAARARLGASRSTRASGGASGGAAAPGELAPTSITIKVENNGCGTNMPFKVDTASGAQNDSTGGSTDVTIAIDALPATVCASTEDWNKCKGNSVKVTKNTKTVSIDAGCHAVAR